MLIIKQLKISLNKSLYLVFAFLLILVLIIMNNSYDKKVRVCVINYSEQKYSKSLTDYLKEKTDYNVCGHNDLVRAYFKDYYDLFIEIPKTFNSFDNQVKTYSFKNLNSYKALNILNSYFNNEEDRFKLINLNKKNNYLSDYFNYIIFIILIFLIIFISKSFKYINKNEIKQKLLISSYKKYQFNNNIRLSQLIIMFILTIITMMVPVVFKLGSLSTQSFILYFINISALALCTLTLFWLIISVNNKLFNFVFLIALIIQIIIPKYYLPNVFSLAPQYRYFFNNLLISSNISNKIFLQEYLINIGIIMSFAVILYAVTLLKEKKNV